ncbi:ubiquitin-specific protease ubp15, partial [Linderina pennispora]
MGQLGENNVRHTIGDPDIPDEGVATPPHSDTGSNHDDMDDSSRQAAAPVPATAPHLPTTLDEEEFMRTNLPPLGKYEAEGWGAFHWEIDNWTALGDKVTSGEFTVAGHKWDILLFPRGNQAEDMVSLYVEYKAAEGMADDWHACANFCLAMSNTSDPSVFTHNVAQHRFTADESDWGFTRFMGLRQLMTPTDADTPALLENNRVRISAYVRVIKDTTGVLWHNFHNYDSRKQTGFVGLRNQGATCYMNSLLQSLYFTNEFRSAVYQIPTENDDPKKSVALALQRVFYNLEHSSEA